MSQQEDAMAVNKRQVQLLPKHPVGTLAGSRVGLREAPRPEVIVPPRAQLSPEQIARHDALRKCIYFPAYPGQPGRPWSLARRSMPQSASRAAERDEDRSRSLSSAASSPLAGESSKRGACRRAARECRSGTARDANGVSSACGQSMGRPGERRNPYSRWLPPVGFMMLWGSSRYTRDAKLAITALMAMFMVLGTAAVCTALIVLR